MPEKVVSQKENTCREERVRRGINMGGYLNPKNHMNLTQTDKSSQSVSRPPIYLLAYPTTDSHPQVLIVNHWVYISI